MTSTITSATSGDLSPPCSICNWHAAIPAIPSTAAIIPTRTAASIPTMPYAAMIAAAGVSTSTRTWCQLGSVPELKLRKTSITTFGAGDFGRRGWAYRVDRLLGRIMRSFVYVGLRTCQLWCPRQSRGRRSRKKVMIGVVLDRVMGAKEL